MFANIDAKLFQERRKESKDLLQIIRNEGAYERKYKLLEGAYEKLLNVRQTITGYCFKIKQMFLLFRFFSKQRT